jgi:DNA-binding CsgD family transcriptional regulator
MRELPHQFIHSAARHVRRMRDDDAAEVARWMTGVLAVPAPLARALPGLLRQLLGDERLLGSVIELLPEGSPVHDGWQLAALGLSGFISDACLDRHLAHPTAHFALTVLDGARRDAHEPNLLSGDEIAWANAAIGLNLLALFWQQRPADLSTRAGRHVFEIGHRALLDAHRGYRLKRVLKEVPKAVEPTLLRWGFNAIVALPAGSPTGVRGRALDHDRVLLGVTREEAERALPATPVATLFVYSQPRCGFTRREQRILELAAEGATDREIAMLLNITPNAVKERWRSIYERVGYNAAFVFASRRARRVVGSARGAEKRRSVIGFIRDHPEELRPYSPT